jgi:lactate racemase
MGKVIADAGVKVFQIETTINNDTFGQDTPMSVLAKREWEWTAKDRVTFVGMQQGLKRLSRAAPEAQDLPGPPGALRRHVGHGRGDRAGARAHPRALLRPAPGGGRGPDRHLDDGPALHLPLQRELDHEPDPGDVPGLGYFFNMYRGKPLVREGGVLIMTHPTPWEFHPVHHPSYIDFFEQVLAETTDPKVIEPPTRSSSPRTSGTATCTARATPTTASTRSTCGTGAATPSSTSAA